MNRVLIYRLSFLCFFPLMSCQLADTSLVQEAVSAEVKESIFTYTNYSSGVPIEIAVRRQDRFFEPRGFTNEAKGRLLGGRSLRNGVIRFRAKFNPSSSKYQMLYYSNAVEDNTHYIIYYLDSKLYLRRGDLRGNIVFPLDTAVIDSQLHTYKIVQSQRTNNPHHGYRVKIFQDDQLIREDNFLYNFNAFIWPFFGYDPRGAAAYRNRDIIGYYTLIDWYPLAYEENSYQKDTISFSSSAGLRLQDDDIFFRKEGFTNNRRGRLVGDKLREGRIRFTARYNSNTTRFQILYYNNPILNDHQYIVCSYYGRLYLYRSDTNLRAAYIRLGNAKIDSQYHTYTIEQRLHGDNTYVVLYQDGRVLTYNNFSKSFNAFISPYFGYDPGFRSSRNLMGDYTDISWLPFPSIDIGTYSGTTFLQENINYTSLGDTFFRLTNVLRGLNVSVHVTKEDGSPSTFMEEFLISQNDDLTDVFHPESTFAKRINFNRPGILQYLHGYNGRLRFNFSITYNSQPLTHIVKELTYHSS